MTKNLKIWAWQEKVYRKLRITAKQTHQAFLNEKEILNNALMRDLENHRIPNADAEEKRCS